MAKPLRLALGACIIQAEYGYSDEETALQIQENPYLQYFCGYPGYDDEKLPFDPSLMVYFRKWLTPEVLGEINEMILRDAKARQSKEAEDKNDLRMSPCSTKPERTRKSFWTFCMILPMARSPAPTANAPGKIT